MPPRLLIPTRAALAAALNDAGVAVRSASLDELPRHGLAHRHWQLRGRGLVLRVPILPGAGDTLDRQAAIFRRAAASGHTPALHAVLPASRALPGGALLVEAIGGRVPRVPEDLPAIARALGAIHSLKLPGSSSPVPAPAESFAATLALIDRNLERGASALTPDIREILEAEREWARRFVRENAKRLKAVPRALIVTDAHPRNFLIAHDAHSGEERAICLDLERGQYASPAIDLAHAVLPIAVAWGRSGETITAPDRARFLKAYFRSRRASAATALRPWLKPFARLIALRTSAAYAAFRASGAERALGPEARALASKAIIHTLHADRLAKIFAAVS
jgi:Ser/Thr protein kinase RdoA (MazF antagonist)